MKEAGFDKMVIEYEATAKIIHGRITELRATRAQNQYDNTLRIEERIAILEAEYGHLLKTAAHMREYQAEHIRKATA